jgi:manganese/zinc/iron transport system substrate-binding protein
MTKKHFSKFLFFLSIIICIGQFFGCSPSQTENGQLKIVCTTGIIEDALVNMYGDVANVQAIMGPGVDPHLYKPSQSDVSLLTHADIIVHNGLHLEGKMSEVLHKLGRTKKVYAMSDGLSKDKLRLLDAKSGVYDPHIWFDTELWRNAVQQVGEAISKDFPQFQSAQPKISKYVHALDSIDKLIRNKVSQIDSTKRILIASHDAFNYFGSAYGVHVRGLQGVSTVAEYGLRDVTDLVNFIIDNNIKTVFIETSVSSRSIDAVIKGCEAKGFKVEIGGKLFSDALGDKGTSEGTYMGMVVYNVNLMIKGWSK